MIVGVAWRCRRCTLNECCAGVQFLSLNAIGTEAFLRARLRTHLNEIKADDIEIKKEGLEQLTDDELRAACRARGMAAPFGRGCTSFMQKQLREWIELSLDRCAGRHHMPAARESCTSAVGAQAGMCRPQPGYDAW